MEKPISKCYHTGKSRFGTKGDAKDAMLSYKLKHSIINHLSQKRYKRRIGKPAQVRVYFCGFCKGYHITSEKDPLTYRKRKERYEQHLKDASDLYRSPDEIEKWKEDSLPFPELIINTKTDTDDNLFN